MTLYYSATHSSGRVHLRKSASRAYSHAIVTKNVGGQSFCGRLDLAQKARDSAYDPSAWEIVPAVAITKDEFNALTKASKQFFATQWRGKKYTKSSDGDSVPFTHAVGWYRPLVTTRHEIDAEQRARDTAHIERLRQLQDHLRNEWDHAGRADIIARLEKNLERGYWEQEHREECCVWWCISEQDARETVESRTKVWDTYPHLAGTLEILEVTTKG